MEQSLDFYRDVLGFSVLLIAEYDNERLRAFVAMEDDAVPTVALMSDDGQRLSFSILHVPGVAIDKIANRKSAPTIVMDRSNIHEIYRKAVARGLDIVFAPQDSLSNQQEIVTRELGIIDPDGNRLLILERF